MTVFPPCAAAAASPARPAFPGVQVLYSSRAGGLSGGLCYYGTSLDRHCYFSCITERPDITDVAAISRANLCVLSNVTSKDSFIKLYSEEARKKNI